MGQNREAYFHIFLKNLNFKLKHVKKGINKIRLKNIQNPQINETLHDSLEESLRNRKTNRECACYSEVNTAKTSQVKKIVQKDKIVTVIDSPVK